VIGRDREAPSRYAQLRDAEHYERERSLPWVVGQLDRTPAEQVAALELLGYWGEIHRQRVGREVAETVARLVGSTDDTVRKEACTTLALLRTEDAFDASRQLIDALGDESAQVRQEAAAALGDLRVEHARGALRRHLDDRHPAVRFEAAYALSALDDASGRAALEDALTSPAFRAFAIEGLRRLGDSSSIPALLKLAKAWATPWPEQLAAWAAAASLGDARAAAEVERRAIRGRLEVRAYAVYLIGHARLRSSKPVVDALADDPRSKLRATAVQALGKFELPEDDPRLEAWLSDERAPSDVRLEALDALGERGRVADIQRWLHEGRFDAVPELRERAVSVSVA
jgi:HEAT repeat protein